MKHKILVVTANYKKAYPVIKAISETNNSAIIAFYHFFSSSIFSKYVHKRYVIANPYRNERKYISNLLKIIHNEDISMIIPVGFIDNITIARYRHLFKGVIIPIPEYEKILEVSNKLTLGRMLKKLGIKYPETSRYVRNRLEVDYPVVLKGLSDASKPVYILHKTAFRNLSIRDSKTIVQQFIVGIGHGYFALAKDGEIYLEFCHKRIIEDPPIGGPSVVACSYYDPVLIRLGRRIVKHLKWNGVIMVELKKDVETGEYYVIEINPKFWGSLELSQACGVDFTKALIDLFLLNKKPKQPNKIPKKCFAWIVSNLKYLKYDYRIFKKIASFALRNGYKFTDLHFNDLSELLYNVIMNARKVFFSRNNILKTNRKIIRNNMKLFLKHIIDNNIKALIFDLDGTIIKLNVNWGALRYLAMKQGLIKPWQSLNEALFHYIRQKDLELFNELNDLIKEYELKAVDKLRFDKELWELFSHIYKMDLKLGIVSKQSRDIIVRVLEKLRLEEFFSSVIGREDALIRETQITLHLQRFNMDPDDALFIGNTLLDIASAARAGVYSVAITDNVYHFYQFNAVGRACFKTIKDFLNVFLITINHKSKSQ